MDPTVEEAIQRLKEGNASPEDARIAFESGYQGGPKTQEYYRQLGLLDSPQDTPPVYNRALTPEEQYAMAQADAKVNGVPTYPKPVTQSQPPQDVLPAGKRALTPAEQYARAQADAKEHSTPSYGPSQDLTPQTELPEQQTEQSENPQPATDVRPEVEGALNRGMQAWSPLAPSILKGGDRSGEAAGYRAGAAIQDKAAADYSKLVQWNKQRAVDNTLADKVAAARASGQWRQNANALGAEGGASVVASRNEAVTPDIMAQKQYQTQQMQNAERNMSEVNARKIAAQNDRTKADMTDYNTQYNESKDAYTYNLATANNSQTNKQNETKEESRQESAKPEATEKPDGKVEDNTQNNESQAAAEVNQQSQATSDATNEVSEQQQLQDIADEINGIYNTVATLKKDAQQNAPQLRELKKRYDELKPQYDELASKSKNPPPQASVPDFGMFDEKLSKVPESVLSGVNQRF